MFNEYLVSLWDMSDTQLRRQRYVWGASARQGDFHAVRILAVIDDVLSVEHNRPCDIEFGRDHNHDDAQCANVLNLMRGDDFDYTMIDYPEYDAETAHYERFGRPAFPNEY